MRGRGDRRHLHSGVGGTTPAGAGTSPSGCPAQRTRGDYPRRCGDELHDLIEEENEDGLPPQVRGRVGHGRGDGVAARTTPAGAGTSGERGPTRARPGDYPRRCGDEPAANRAADLAVSSGERTTPAGAGTSCPWGSTWWGPTDYPRRCGDEPIRARSPSRPRGLPPQVRGRGEHGRADRVGGGTTPAGAGTRMRPGRSCGGAWDYPRRCGDEEGSEEDHDATAGLPPQVRGRGVLRRRRRQDPGTTPAGAGTSSSAPSPAWARPDYPRRCGDEITVWTRTPPNRGLPPQVRGRGHGDEEDERLHGTTPAGAGTRLVELRFYGLKLLFSFGCEAT